MGSPHEPERRAEESLRHCLAVVDRLRAPSFGGSPAIVNHMIGVTLDVAGESYLDLERWQEAADHYRQALPELRARPIGRAVALALTHYGHALVRLGRAEEAREAFGEALELHETAGGTKRAAEVLAELDRLADHSEGLSQR
ncbi:tetratricopeptide repeat protein [Nonomuraea sp. NPDC049784]|uniref:tetratricopeptide repeat protein n=1 Tax=Nonomuraea sp. NPDC049784 TaxID=3154361 RepID=UPI0033C059B3